LNEEVPSEELEQKKSQEPLNAHPELQSPPYLERINQEKPLT